MDLPELLAKECTPCTNKTPRLKYEQAQSYLKLLPNWQIQEEKLEREIKSKNFEQSLILANHIGKIAQSQNHHPDIYISWQSLKVMIYTHSIKGLSESDFILAAKIDKLINTNLINHASS